MVHKGNVMLVNDYLLDRLIEYVIHQESDLRNRTQFEKGKKTAGQPQCVADTIVWKSNRVKVPIAFQMSVLVLR